MNQNVDPSKFTYTKREVLSDGILEIWLFYNGSHVASGMANGTSLGIINAQNDEYFLAARTFLMEHFPQYNWKGRA